MPGVGTDKMVHDLHVLYEDPHIIVVWKPVGVQSQESRGFGRDMVSEIRKHIHNLSPVGGTPYVGVIHRLDQPVSGVLVYAKTKKAAAALSRQVATGQMKKKYLAVFCGKAVDNVDNFVDYLLKDEKENRSGIVDKGTAGAKCARLSCEILEEKQVEPYGFLGLARITLQTGRHHQIRVQMAGHGLPLWGDSKYNPMFAERGKDGTTEIFRTVGTSALPGNEIGLAAYFLELTHPVTGKRMEFTAMPQGAVFREFAWVRERVRKESLEKNEL